MAYKDEVGMKSQDSFTYLLRNGNSRNMKLTKGRWESEPLISP